MLSRAGLEQSQLSFEHTWLEGREYRIKFTSRITNPVQHEADLGVFWCRCVTDRPGRHWEAVVTLRNPGCPVHCPDTSKEIREALERMAKRLRRLTGSARELYEQQNGNAWGPYDHSLKDLDEAVAKAESALAETRVEVEEHRDTPPPVQRSEPVKHDHGHTTPPDPPSELRGNPYAWLELE